MRASGRDFSLNDVLGLALLRSLRPASVVSIYPEEHSSTSWHRLENAGAGRADVSGELAAGAGVPNMDVDVEWDEDEPPTQMWGGGQILAATHAQPTAARLQPTAAGRSTRARPRSIPPAIPEAALAVSKRTLSGRPSSVPPALPAAARISATPAPTPRPAAHASQRVPTGQHPAQRVPTGQHAAFSAHSSQRVPTGQHAAFGAMPGMGQALPPRSPRSSAPALLPQLANDPRYYPGLVEPESFETPASKRPKWFWHAVVGGASCLLVVAAGVLWPSASPSSVLVETTPADAEVSIDGQPVLGSASPFSQGGVQKGEHVLVVHKTGFLDQRLTFSVNAGETKHMPLVRLEPVAQKLRLSVVSLPAGAEVAIDGSSVGLQTPAEISSLTNGAHTVRLTLPGYAPAEQTVRLPDETSLSLTLTAQPSAATASAAAPAAEKRYTSAQDMSLHELRAARVAARYRARRGLAPKPEDAAVLAAAPLPSETGSRHATKSYASHHASTHSTSHTKTQGTSAHASMSAPVSEPEPEREAAPAKSGGTGTLQINSRPWAEVYVDGKRVGNTPQMALQLSAGPHSVKLVNPQMGMSKTLSITIQAGQKLTKVETLSE